MQTQRQKTTQVLLPLLLVGLLLALAGSLSACTRTPERFPFVVHVQNDANGQRVPNARVTIDVPGRYRSSSTTNSDGFATFLIDASVRGENASITVEADLFQPYEQGAELETRTLPFVAKIQRR